MRSSILCCLFRPALRRRLAILVLSGAAGAAVACPPSPGATCDAGGDAPASQPLEVGVNLGTPQEKSKTGPRRAADLQRQMAAEGIKDSAYRFGWIYAEGGRLTGDAFDSKDQSFDGVILK